MRFHARVGILPHERELAQPLSIDASVIVDSGSVLDYRQLYDAVEGIVSAEPHDYLENIASRAADAALELPGVQRVEVVVRKPHVMLPGPLDGAEVTLVRQRAGRDGK